MKATEKQALVHQLRTMADQLEKAADSVNADEWEKAHDLVWTTFDDLHEMEGEL